MEDSTGANQARRGALTRQNQMQLNQKNTVHLLLLPLLLTWRAGSCADLLLACCGSLGHVVQRIPSSLGIHLRVEKGKNDNKPERANSAPPPPDTGNRAETGRGHLLLLQENNRTSYHILAQNRETEEDQLIMKTALRHQIRRSKEILC